MDPRKTVVIADFDEVLRAAREPRVVPPEAAEEGRPAPDWGAQTLSWPSGGEAKDAVRSERKSDVREKLSQATQAAKASPTVLIGRTVVTGSESRKLAAEDTSVWRREVTSDKAVFDGERQRAQVQIDEAVMQRLAAEVWAGQASQGSHMLVTTVRRSIVDVSTSHLTQRTNETQTASHAQIERVTKAEASVKTEVLARVATEDEPLVIPRLIRIPDAKTVRIVCLGLCIASAGAIAFSRPALQNWRGPAQPSATSTGVGAAAAHGGGDESVNVETTWRPRTAPVPPAAQRPERKVEDVTAAQPRERKLEDVTAAQLRSSQRVTAGGTSTASDASKLGPARPQIATAAKLAPGSGSGSGKTAPAVPSSSASPRAALDALIAGKQELALARYRALAKSDPSQPAYETAARILEEAMQRGTAQP